MRGMPQLYYASGGGRRPQWVGSVLVVDDAADVRRLYQREDALPLTEDEPGPGRASLVARLQATILLRIRRNHSLTDYPCRVPDGMS
jgi:hypothetical protein